MSRTISMQVFLFSLLGPAFLCYAEASSQCSLSDFKCSNGRCISISSLCDGYDNCEDNSDELVCDAPNCHPTTFQCSNGKCINRRWVCEEADDCGDNSDERHCNPYECHPLSFQCLNGKCISRYFFCYLGGDCGDNSDERYCNINSSVQCPPGWTRCPSGSRCIPSNWVCDGWTDCPEISEETDCDPKQYPPTSFPCFNGRHIGSKFFCDGEDGCRDNSDENYCNIDSSVLCPPGWFRCPIGSRCIPSHWVCDGFTACNGESEETHCELKSWFLRRRKSGSRTDRWGSEVHRIAVALHLADDSTFDSGNITGEEIRHELTVQLLLAKDKKMNSQELALYIHALLVACVDPKDFYGDDLVRNLRRRVEEGGNYTNPFLILVLCNAGDVMTARDVERVTAAYGSQHRPFWTDSQALATMALSCISSRSGLSVDERPLKNMLQELKRRQFRNGTVDNFRTTALVTQALFIHESYSKGFDLESAMKALIDGQNTSRSLLDAYYALPVLSRKSLLNVTSAHCRKEPDAEEEALKKLLYVSGETMTVHYSVWMGDKINLERTCGVKVRVNSTIYDAIEIVAKIDYRQKVGYNVVDGKPYVAALNGKEDDPEMGMFWFVYLKTLSSDKDPKIVEESPVDIKLMPNQEIILWYKLGPWNLMQKPVTPS